MQRKSREREYDMVRPKINNVLDDNEKSGGRYSCVLLPGERAEDFTPRIRDGFLEMVSKTGRIIDIKPV